MARIGILGGTFDPVHFGHIHLALAMSEAHGLDEVWWIPAQKNPLKESTVVSAQDRLKMLHLALDPIAAFKIKELELLNPNPSYTINTLRKLKEDYPRHDFYLLLGDDALGRFHEWKEPEQVIQLGHPLIGTRQLDNHFPDNLPLSAESMLQLKKGWTPIPHLEISATDIRKRLKERRFCGHLVPAKVLDYIVKNGLYFRA